MGGELDDHALAVERGLERRQLEDLREIGVDEKSFQRRHNYVTVVNNLIGSRVLYVADDRKQESLEAFWVRGLTDTQRAGIEAIAMDMWEPYVQATLARIPDAESKIVFDRFHVAMPLNDAVDRVRRTEARELRAAGDSRLVGTKYAWLRSPDNFDDEAWREFAPLRRWYFWATHSRLQPTAAAERPDLYQAPDHERHQRGSTRRSSGSVTLCAGFRNRENFKTAIYFHCGRLDLYPLPTHTKVG